MSITTLFRAIVLENVIHFTSTKFLSFCTNLHFTSTTVTLITNASYKWKDCVIVKRGLAKQPISRGQFSILKGRTARNHARACCACHVILLLTDVENQKDCYRYLVAAYYPEVRLGRRRAFKIEAVDYICNLYSFGNNYRLYDFHVPIAFSVFCNAYWVRCIHLLWVS